jgi:hypothetical protein
MSGLRALAYLEACKLRNTVRKIITNPGRLAMWALFALWWGFTIFNGSRHRFSFVPSIDPRTAAFGAGAILIFLGLRTALATRSANPPVAGTALDAIMLARTAIAEPLVFLWLYGRRLLSMFWRGLIILAVTFFFLMHTSMLPQLIAIVGVLLLVEASSVPFFLLARRSRIGATAVAIAITISGLSIVVMNALRPDTVAPIGALAMRIWNGDGQSIVLIYVAVATSFLCSFGVNDIYATLYERALRMQTLRERLRHGRTVIAGSAPSRSATRSPLRGPYAEIWKQLAYTRRRNGMAIAIGILALGPVLGAAAAFFAVRNSDDTLAAAIMGVFTAVIILGQTGVSLAGDISKPLWWITDGSLYTHLCAWIIGGVLPLSVILATSSVTAGILLHSAAIVAIGVTAGLLAPASMRALSMLTYVLSPSKADQRGPGMVVRILVLYAAIIITGAVTAAAIIFTRNLAVSYTAGIATFASTGAAALLIAARRIDGRGMEIALAEAA